MDRKNILKINVFAAVLVILMSIGTICAVCLLRAREKDHGVAFDPSAKPKEEVVNVTPDTVYILREHEGKLCVFDQGGNMLERLDVPLVALPTADRQKLSDGITVNGDAELARLKEDFTG
jgi:hypothetical protein